MVPEAVELPDLVEWIYEENQAVPDGLDKAIPALLEWIGDRFAELEQQAGTLGWAVIPESPMILLLRNGVMPRPAVRRINGSRTLASSGSGSIGYVFPGRAAALIWIRRRHI